MRTPLVIGGLALATLSRATLFDNFSSGAYDSGNLTAIATTNAWQTPATVPGNVRFVQSAIVANPFNQNYRVQIVPGFGMTFVDSGVGLKGNLSLGYGYANGSTAAVSNPLNLNQTGSPIFAVTFMSNDLPNATTVTLYSSTTGGSVARAFNVPALASPATFNFDFTGEAALADVDSVLVSFSPSANGDFGVSRIESVPEPASIAAIGIGLVGIARTRRRRSK